MMRHVKGFWNEVAQTWTFDVDVLLVEMAYIRWELDQYLGQVEYSDGSWLDIFYAGGRLVGVETEGEE